MMKKFFYLAIAAVMTVALASCDQDKPDKKAPFAITVSDITATTADVAITPKDAEALYYWNILTAEEYEAVMNGDFAEYEIIDMASYNTYMIDFMIQLYAQYGMQLTVDDLLSKGPDGQVLEGLNPETKYVVVALAADAQGVCSGEACTAEFTTTGVPQSANKITLSYTNGKINITTTNNDPYIFWIESKAEYEQYQKDYSDASLKAEMDEWLAALNKVGYTDEAIMNGSASINPATEFWANWFEDPMTAGEYIAWAIPYNAQYNGPATYITFNYAGGAAAPAAPSHNLVKKIAGKAAPAASVRSFVVK